MRCPKCSSTDSRVVDSRTPSQGASIRRRRECMVCGHRFSTMEQLLNDDLQVLKRDGTIEPMDKAKLVSSLKKALLKRPHNLEQIQILIQDTLDHLQNEFDTEIPTQAIAEALMARLRSVDWIAYVRYASNYRKFQEVHTNSPFQNNPSMT
jgi:transcriptional repressor NrdR